MSENYQSRVFTFISNRTNQLKDSCAKSLRHLKVAVIWSGQILLYPLHLLAQTTKIFQTQLAPPPQQLALSSQPISDINIEQALELVAGAGYPIVIADCRSLTVAEKSIVDENLWNIEHSNNDIEDWEIVASPRKSRQMTDRKSIIRGLSSLLIDRQLVLVTTENEILDILTISQQQEIRRRIGIDLATTWHQWHTGKISSNHSPKQLSAKRQLLLTDETPIEWLAIDRQEKKKKSPNLFDVQREKLRQRWHDWLKSFNTNPLETLAHLGSTQDRHSGIKINKIKPESPRQLPSTSHPFTPQPPKIGRFDLPQLPPIAEIKPIPSQSKPIQATITKLQPDWLKQWWNYYRDYLYIPSKTNSQIIKKPAEFKLIPIDLVPEKIKLRETSRNQDLLKQSSGELSKKVYQNLEHCPDWIEAESETIGYNKSLVAKLLAWLDRVTLQIENWLIKVWKAIANYPTQS